MSYFYEDELREELTKFNEVKTELDEINGKYENIRNRLQKWMELNNLTTFNTKDNSGSDWNIGFEPRKTKKIKDYKLLEQALGEDYSELVETYESSVFKCMKKPKRD